jgi:predicted ATPase
MPMAAPAPQPFLQYVTLLRDRVPSFDEYPFSIPAIRHLEHLELHPKVTYFVGENGTGKSTLLEAIALVEGFNPEGGSRHFNFSTRVTHSSLGECLRLGRGIRRLKSADGFFLRAESFYNAATYVDSVADPLYLARNFGGIPPHERSHGESFFSLMLDRFKGSGLYLFDEPESALSPMRQMSLLSIMHDLIHRGTR